MNPSDRPAKPDPEQLRVLLDDPLSLEELVDPAVVVPMLPVQSFVRIARRLRDEGRLELLLPHATSDQLTSLMDLDAWAHERLDYAAARTWLHAIADSYGRAMDKPRGALADLIHDMDPEVWTLSLAPGTRVAVLDVDEDDARDRAADQLDGLRIFEAPDGFFLVGVPDDELGRMTIRTIQRIYEDSLSEGRKLMLSINASLPSQIEEDLRRWRSGRLADLGFVEWEEAMRLFRPLARDAAVRQSARDFAYLRDDDHAEVVTFTGPELLRRVMTQLSDDEHGVRSREFLLLVNEVMAAQRMDPGDDASQARAVAQTQATLSLGLELLEQPGHPDPDGFLAERITALGLRDVFRVGYGALDKLRKAARALHAGGRVSLSSVGSLLDRPWGPAIATFSRWYPELPLSGTSKGTRPIGGLGDVAVATELIAQAGALAHVCFAPAGFAADPVWIGRVDEPERLTLGDLVRTAVLCGQVAGGRGFAPLSPDDLAWSNANLLAGGRLIESVRTAFADRCRAAGVEDHIDALSKNLLTRLEVELASVEFDDDGVVDLTRTGGLLTVQSIGMWLKTEGGVVN